MADDDSAVIYFGCWDRTGHGYHDERGRSLGPVSPWGYKIDGLHEHGAHIPQGTRYLAHKDGWTALDVTDRTVDKRPGSHSAFLAPGDLNLTQMLALAWGVYPRIAERIGLPRATQENVDAEGGSRDD